MLSRSLPNLITCLRIVAAPVLAWFIIQAQYQSALWTIVFAGLTDWLDGYTARRLHDKGKLGIVLDPAADKLMLVTLFVALTFARLVPAWFLVLALGRDCVIVVGALLVRIFRNVRTFLPTMLGKVSTFFQIVLGLLAVVFAAFPFDFLLWLDRTALVLATLFTFASGVDYVRIGIRLASEPRRETPEHLLH